MNILLSISIIIVAIVAIKSYIIHIRKVQLANEIIKNNYAYKRFLNDNGFNSTETSQNPTLKEYELCLKFLEVNPQNETAQIRYAQLCFELGQFNDALEIYKTLVEKLEYDLLFIIDYAKCYCCLNQDEKAFELIDKYYAKKEDGDKYYATIALMYSSLKNYDKAIEFYSTAINLNSDNPAYYKSRAENYKALNMISEYEADINKYTKLVEDGINLLNKSMPASNSFNYSKSLKP